MDGLIERRVEPREEVSEPIVPSTRVWGSSEVRAAREEEAAEAARRLPVSDARARDFARAKEHLAKLTYVQVIDVLQALPQDVLEMYLLAEEDSTNREEVKRFFPKPSARIRERYAAVVGA